MTYLLPTGERVEAAVYARYLRRCAADWRARSNDYGMTPEARAKNEEQAKRVEAKADRIERGEE